MRYHVASAGDVGGVNGMAAAPALGRVVSAALAAGALAEGLASG